MNEIDKLREQIDTIDDELISLIEKRMELVSKIGIAKKTGSLTITDTAREDEVIKKGLAKLKNKDFSREIKGFLEYVIQLSKDIQQNITNKSIQ